MGCASEQGTLELLHKCRGEDKAVKTLYNEMKTRGYSGGKVRIAHCFNPNAAEALAGLIRADFKDAEIKTELCGALCSFYAERGGMLVGYEDAIK